MGTAAWIGGGAFVLFILIPSIVLLSVSFAKLEATEIGLDYNNNVKEIDNKTYEV
jgi:hypothetical protein